MTTYKSILIITFLMTIVLSGCDPEDQSGEIPADKVDYQLGEISIAGNGCLEGTAEATPTADGKNLSVTFKDFELLTDNKKLVRKVCNLAIPISIPKGLKLKVANSPALGSLHVSEEGKAYVKVETFLAGAKGEALRRDYAALTTLHNQELVGSSEFTQEECGGEVIIRVSLSALAKAGQADDTHVLLDSLANEKGEALKIAFEKCDQ